MIGLVALLVFTSAVLAGYAVSNLAESREEARRALTRRLATMTGTAGTLSTPLMKDRRLSGIPVFDAFLVRIPFVRRLVVTIRQAGLKRRAGEVLLYIPLLACMAYLVTILMGGTVMLGLLIGGVAGALPMLILQHMRKRRMALFAEQLPDGLDLIRAALQAGHGFLSSLNVVAEEFPDPIAEELREVAEEMRLGLPIRDALYNLVDRVDDSNLPILVIGVLVAQESGGNLAEVIDNISYTIRERFKLLRETQVLTAQGRLSGTVLTALPFLVGTGVYLLNPVYFSPMFTTTTGQHMLVYGLASILVGHLIIRRLVQIRV